MRRSAYEEPLETKPAATHSLRAFATALAVGALVSVFAAGIALGVFSDSGQAGANNFTTDTLNAPRTLTANVSAGGVSLAWLATADTYADGHQVFRSVTSGGPFTQIGTSTPRSNTIYVDTPGNGTFYYRVRAFRQNWTSGFSNTVSASTAASVSTGYLACSANVEITTGSGDNNGYEASPSAACSDDGIFASDVDSGTNAETACGNAGKDRHRYYDYSFSIPAGAQINGVQVRLDAWADANVGIPRICVQLSWNADGNRTSAKMVNLTATEASYILGSATDTWGRVWSDTELSNANFRVRVSNVATDNTRDFFLDYVAVSIYYTPP